MPDLLNTSAVMPVSRHLRPLRSSQLVDRALEPAEHLVGDRGQRNRNDIALELVLIELAVELEAAAVIDPAHVVDHVHAERAARRRAEQRRGALLADPVGRGGVAAVDHLLVDGVEHLEGRHDGAGRQRLRSRGARRDIAFTRSAQNLKFSKIRLEVGKLAWKRSFCGAWALTGGGWSYDE